LIFTSTILTVKAQLTHVDQVLSTLFFLSKHMWFCLIN
jgi:hypothetical protein